MTKKNNIKGHDHFFAKSMSRIKVAKEFFEDTLPDNIKEKVNLNTLKPLPTRFIDNELAEGTVDMLYEVSFNGTLGYLYILCEHQSSPDNLMTLRIQKYMLRICSEHKKKHPKKKLPLIYPILLYSGKKKYSAPLLFWELFEDEELAKQFFTNPIHMVDASKIPDNKIREHIYSGLMLHFLRKIHTKEILPFIQELVGIIQIISEKDFTYIEDLLLYILEKGESNDMDQVLITFQKAVTKNNKDKIMTIAEQLIAKGKLEGLEKGKAEAMKLAHQMKVEAEEKGIEKGIEKVAINMLLKKVDEKVISESTGFSVEELQRLRKEK